VAPRPHALEMAREELLSAKTHGARVVVVGVAGVGVEAVVAVVLAAMATPLAR
jgi:hypothetical protein